MMYGPHADYREDCTNFQNKLLDQKMAEMVAGETKQVLQSFFFCHGEGSLDIVVAPWDSDKSRERAMIMLRLRGVEIDAHWMCAISEVWVAPGPLPKGVMPMNSDQRREGLLCLAVWRTGYAGLGKRGITREIERGADGNVCGFAKADASKDLADICGELTDLLAPTRPTTMFREQARMLSDRLFAGSGGARRPAAH